MRNRKVLLQNKKAIPRNKCALLEKRQQFWKIKEHIDLRTRALVNSALSTFCSGHVSMFQAKIKIKNYLGPLFSYGSDILTFKFPKIFPESTMGVSNYYVITKYPKSESPLPCSHLVNFDIPLSLQMFKS